MAKECFACAKFKWPQWQPPCYIDQQTLKGYCFFHATADNKKMAMDGKALPLAMYHQIVYGRLKMEMDKVEKGDREQCTFDGAIFPEGLLFVPGRPNNTLSNVSFKYCTFGSTLECNKTAICGFVDLQNSKLEKGALFENISKESLRNLIYSTKELQNITFRNCRWPKRLGLEVYGNGEESNLLECEELYRAMKQRAAEDHDQLLVSRWHYREKLMAMKRGGNNAFEQAMLWLYFACSGFGERAGQSLLVLLALVGLSLLANAWTPSWDWNAVLPWANAVNATLPTILFAKDIPGDGWVKVGRGFWQFLIAVQFTLFALAVRNRFRR